MLVDAWIWRDAVEYSVYFENNVIELFVQIYVQIH